MDLITLQQQLADFGLNPSDWVLEIKRHVGLVVSVEVHARGGGDLHFVGLVRRNAWVTLALQDS